MSSQKQIISVVGTRPNFMKMAPIIDALQKQIPSVNHLLVHTGQHYDTAMSDVFFDQLKLHPPDISLAVGSGTHSTQTARIMELLEPVFSEHRPDLVLIPGDVNSTLAAALVAAKMNIPIGHVEAGLRSFDRTMPEEINRIVTDTLSTLLFTHSPEAKTNLQQEGIPAEKIFAVGNTMIDTLVRMREQFKGSEIMDNLGVSNKSFLVVTLHRPALVDNSKLLLETLQELNRLAEHLPIVFPIHPRTRKNLSELGFDETKTQIIFTEPLGYIEFLALVSGSAGVITDSGGIQEETTFLRVPCFTLRDNTERPITISNGTNILLGLTPQRIREIPERIQAAEKNQKPLPVGWDGNAAQRITDVLAAYITDSKVSTIC